MAWPGDRSAILGRELASSPSSPTATLACERNHAVAQQNLGKHFAVDVTAGQHRPYTLAPCGPIFQQSGQPGSSRTFRHVMSVDKVSAHRILHLIVLYH